MRRFRISRADPRAEVPAQEDVPVIDPALARQLEEGIAEAVEADLGQPAAEPAGTPPASTAPAQSVGAPVQPTAAAETPPPRKGFGARLADRLADVAAMAKIDGVVRSLREQAVELQGSDENYLAIEALDTFDPDNRVEELKLALERRAAAKRGTAAEFDQVSKDVTLKVDNATIHVGPEEASLECTEPMMSATEAYAFAKSVVNTPEISQNGIKLDYMNENDQVVPPTQVESEVLYNLAMTLRAAESNGVRVQNAEEIREALALRPEIFRRAEVRWVNFTEDADLDPKVVQQKAELTDLVVAPDPEQLLMNFDQPLGPMLASAGVLTPLQLQQSGEVQARMKAVSDRVAQNDMIGGNCLGFGKKAVGDVAKEAIGIKTRFDKRKGARVPDLTQEGDTKLDLDALGKLDGATFDGIRSQLGISDEAMEAARNEVAVAELKKSGVKGVTPIGFIHNDLHSRSIPNFGDVKQAALAAQRVVDVAQALERIRSGEPNAEAGAHKRAPRGKEHGFGLWGDEPPFQQGIIQFAERINKIESRVPGGQKMDPEIVSRHVAELHGHVEAIAQEFVNAGREDLASQLEDAQAYVEQRFNPNAPKAERDGPTAQA